MNSIPTATDPGFRQWKYAILAIAVSALLHGAVWRAWLTMKTEPEPKMTSPQIIEVSLIAAQAAPSPPQPQVQPPTEPPKPQAQPKKPAEKPAPKKPSKPKPAPRPTPRPEPSHAPVEESLAPMQARPAPVQAQPAAPAPTPFVEATYKSPSLNNPPTRYPRLALERQWEGTVTLRVQVLASGSAGEIKVERSSGHEILDEATVEQVKNWRFIPARKGDQAVVSWVIVPIEYKIKR